MSKKNLKTIQLRFLQKFDVATTPDLEGKAITFEPTDDVVTLEGKTYPVAKVSLPSLKKVDIDKLTAESKKKRETASTPGLDRYDSVKPLARYDSMNLQK